MVECPYCEEEYTHLASHWYHSPSHRPELSSKQMDVIIGMLMGDGHVSDRKNKNSYLETSMISPNYLKYLDNLFGCLATGVSLHKTAAENAKMTKNSGFSPKAKKENYYDVYRWKTRSHPKFNKFREWYSSGKKVWPENIELTSTVLKHWYCGDGNYDNSYGHSRISIAMSNEVENTEKVSQYFINAGLPEPSNYKISERKCGSKKCEARWTVKGSKKLFSYMGEPLPDFEYKWPEEYR